MKTRVINALSKCSCEMKSEFLWHNITFFLQLTIERRELNETFLVLLAFHFVQCSHANKTSRKTFVF